MKKFIFFGFVFVILILILASAQASLEVSSVPSSLTIFRSENVSSSFVLKNTGNETIENITLSADLPQGVTVFFNQTNFNLGPNSSIVLGFTLVASSNASLGEYTARINATSANETVGFTFLLKIKKHYCSYGKRGNALLLSVQEPDENDVFYAGEKISIELTLENTNSERDVVIETELFDPAKEETISDTSLEDTLDEDEEKDYTLELKIPYDINSGKYFLYVKAYEDGNEEEQCAEKEISVEIRKRTHSLLIEKKTFKSVAACGESLGLALRIANAGKKDEDDVKVRIYSETINFSVEQIKDIPEGTKKNFFFEDTLPIVAPGKYLFRIHVSSDYVDVYDTFEMELKDNCKVEIKNVSIQAETPTSFVGQETRIRVTIRNTGNVKTTYFFGARNYESWTSSIRIEPESLELDSGEEGNFFVVLIPSEQALTENYLKLVVTFDGRTTEETITVYTRKETERVSAWREFLFQIERNKGLAIFIACLIVLVVILAIVVVKRKTRRSKQGEGSRKEGKQKRAR